MTLEMKDKQEKKSNKVVTYETFKNPKKFITHYMSSFDLWDERETNSKPENPKKSFVALDKPPRALGWLKLENLNKAQLEQGLGPLNHQITALSNHYL